MNPYQSSMIVCITLILCLVFTTRCCKDKDPIPKTIDADNLKHLTKQIPGYWEVYKVTITMEHTFMNIQPCTTLTIDQPIQTEAGFDEYIFYFTGKVSQNIICPNETTPILGTWDINRASNDKAYIDTTIGERFWVIEGDTELLLRKDKQQGFTTISTYYRQTV